MSVRVRVTEGADIMSEGKTHKLDKKTIIYKRVMAAESNYVTFTNERNEERTVIFSDNSWPFELGSFTLSPHSKVTFQVKANPEAAEHIHYYHGESKKVAQDVRKLHAPVDGGSIEIPAGSGSAVSPFITGRNREN
jgi:hypothetical protein